MSADNFEAPQIISYDNEGNAIADTVFSRWMNYLKERA